MSDEREEQGERDEVQYASHDEEQCSAEFIDGSWDTAGCGCSDCVHRESERIDSAVEMGYMSEEEAEEAHRNNGSWDDEEAAYFETENA